MSRFSDHRLRWAVLAAVGSALCAGAVQAQQTPARHDIGRIATPEEIRGWDIDVRGDDGQDLPPGRSTARQGEGIYLAQCAGCHGDFGEGKGRGLELMGGQGTLTSDAPLRTIGSYWPYAPTLFDYIRRTMPFAAPQSLSDDEVYAVTAYLLHLNDLLPIDAELDAATLAAIRMPNRDRFVQADPRPDTPSAAEPCMSNCRTTPPRITSDLAERLGVTPDRKPAD